MSIWYVMTSNDIHETKNIKLVKLYITFEHTQCHVHIITNCMVLSDNPQVVIKARSAHQDSKALFLECYRQNQELHLTMNNNIFNSQV